MGIDSAFSLVEAITTAFNDGKRKWVKHKIAFLVCLVAFLGGILFTTRAGLYFLDIVDHFVNAYNLIFVGVLQCIFVGWVYGADRLRRYINSVSDWKIGRWWNFAIKFLVPALLILLLVLNF